VTNENDTLAGSGGVTDENDTLAGSGGMMDRSDKGERTRRPFDWRKEMGKNTAINILFKILKSRWLYIILFGSALIMVSVITLNGISRQADENQIEFLQNAVRRSAVQCYALEGRFPEDVRYLEDNYSLIIDRTRYNVYYEFMGGNLIPQIWVLPIVQQK
jgi:hypothetical protein